MSELMNVVDRYRDHWYQAGYDAGYEQGKKDAVVHGKWEWFDNTITQRNVCRGYRCSICGRIEEFDNEPYCHCGAKMDTQEGAEG